ncbi:MAG: hypothetical protein RLZZ528_454 [Pseudomonadota bacterium]
MVAKTLLAVLALTVAAPAFANSGTDQLALSLGVQPGALTASELSQLQSAVNDDDQARIDFILARAAGKVSRADTAGTAYVSAGKAQIAAQVGVDAAAFSTNDLIRLQDALRSGDEETVAFILNGSDNGDVTTDRGVVTPGKAQLAASLGLNAAEYTTAELSALYLDSIN